MRAAALDDDAAPGGGTCRCRVDIGIRTFWCHRRKAALVNGGGNVDTYNIYMDELPTGEEFDGEEMVEVEFRVVPATNDDGDAEANAVIAGLDLVDLINLRDALQQEIDDYALAALESEALKLAETE